MTVQMTVRNVLRTDHGRRPKSVSRGESELVAATVHELRVPLSHIKGLITNLRRTDLRWDDETRLDFLAEIDAETDRFARLVDALLPAPAASAIRVYTSPCAVVAGGLHRVRGLLSERAVRVEVSRLLPTFRMDSGQMEIVVANLVENTVNQSPPCSTIVISARIVANGDLELSVDDDGPCIPVDGRERIFEAFIRGQIAEQSLEQGFGLRMAICRSIVESHGGHIWVYDHPVKGTRYSVLLPSRLCAQSSTNSP